MKDLGDNVFYGGQARWPGPTGASDRKPLRTALG